MGLGVDSYDKALICRNGHVVATSLHLSPMRGAGFCIECGAGLLDVCPSCGAMIRGHLNLDWVMGGSDRFTFPKYCHSCSAAYPWTDAALKAARDLADELIDTSASVLTPVATLLPAPSKVLIPYVAFRGIEPTATPTVTTSPTPTRTPTVTATPFLP